jgi:acyl phosphate:glycerol-3-phosphate acyltransferase
VEANFVTIAIWTIVSFLCGSLPFSLWIGRLLIKKDIRAVGDGNPGAINAFKSGGWHIGVLALILDISKAAAPSGLAYQVWGWKSWEIVPVALAPLFGSAFSPFLKFKGGKSLSVALGMWVGLTIWKAPAVILASLVIAFLFLTISGWAIVVSAFANGIYLYLWGADAVIWIIFLIQLGILFWKQRDDLRQPPRLRAWLTGK